MFDIGWSELMIIGVVALIVVGPKDLPMMFRKVGNFVGKARGMARDFQSAMNQAADESGVKDLADSVKKPEDIESVATIVANGNHLLDLICDILDLSKVEAGKLELESISSCPFNILRGVEQLMEVRASDGSAVFLA